MAYEWHKDALHYIMVWLFIALVWVGGMSFWNEIFAMPFPYEGTFTTQALIANSITSLVAFVFGDKIAHFVLKID